MKREDNYLGRKAIKLPLNCHLFLENGALLNSYYSIVKVQVFVVVYTADSWCPDIATCKALSGSDI